VNETRLPIARQYCGVSALELVLVILLSGASIALAVITFLKGKYGFGVLGIFIWVFWLVGAIRLAKPDSVWARNFYDEERVKEATERFDEWRWQARITERGYEDELR
jgi:hypothetical protein